MSCSCEPKHWDEMRTHQKLNLLRQAIFLLIAYNFSTMAKESAQQLLHHPKYVRRNAATNSEV